MSLQYGKLRPTSGWDPSGSLGHPSKFQRVSRLGSVTARHLVVGVNQTLRRWTEGATYIRQGGHHVGHWPTFLVTLYLLRPRERLRSNMMSMSVCGSVCLSVCPPGYPRNHTPDLYQIFVHVVCVRGSDLLRQVYDRPHRIRLSRKRGFLLHWKCIISRGRGMGVHSAGEVCYLRLPCINCYSLLHCLLLLWTISDAK